MTTYSPEDRDYMVQALDEAEKVKGSTFPNPAVGAVIVTSAGIVAKGATAPAGGDHAEIRALKQAGGNTEGATLYVTLEPCSHQGRTPPCTLAVASAGIRKVFIATEDPNPLVSGKGIGFLRSKGIEVHIGLLREPAMRLNEDFFWSITQHRAWITVKLALTLDGRIADTRGASKWITNKESRCLVHELRRRHAAIAVGRKTLEIDNPSLDVRHVKGPSPARIVFMSHPNLDPKSRLAQSAALLRTILVCPGEPEGGSDLFGGNIEVWRMGRGSVADQLHIFSEMAHKEDLSSVFVEGGQGLAGSFLEAGLVNRLILFYGNKILGEGLSPVKLSAPRDINGCFQLSDMEVRILGNNIMVSGKPGPEASQCLQD